MSSLIKNDFEISDVSSSKPSLEEVFVRLTSKPAAKKSLNELLEEMDNNPDFNEEER